MLLMHQFPLFLVSPFFPLFSVIPIPKINHRNAVPKNCPNLQYLACITNASQYFTVTLQNMRIYRNKYKSQTQNEGVEEKWQRSNHFNITPIEGISNRLSHIRQMNHPFIVKTKRSFQDCQTTQSMTHRYNCPFPGYTTAMADPETITC